MTLSWSVDAAGRFFVAWRERFGVLSSKRAASIERLVATMSADPAWLTVQHAAYGIATAHHETARTFEPIAEYADGWDYDVTRNPRKARALGNTEPGDGPRFKGRGFVQLTGRGNYRRAGQLLGIDLEAAPERMLEWDPSYAVMTAGMYGRGLTFTGRKLEDFDRGAGLDYVGARRIINGTDRAELIAGHARKYEACLLAALEQTAGA